MELFSAVRDTRNGNERSRFLDSAVPLPWQRLNTKLDAALADLGRINYELDNAVARLITDLEAESYDCLPVQLMQRTGPGISAALAQLVAEIRAAKELAHQLGTVDDGEYAAPR